MEQTANALPPVTLGQYKGLPVTRRVRPVTEAAVASELKSLARRHAPFCATSAPAARGMRVTLDFEGFLDDASTPDSHDGQDGAQQSNQLDLNTADLGELQTLKGVGPVTAQRILDYRTQIGRFDNVDQLLEVKGIGSKTLAKFRDQVCVR